MKILDSPHLPHFPVNKMGKILDLRKILNYTGSKKKNSPTSQKLAI